MQWLLQYNILQQKQQQQQQRQHRNIGSQLFQSQPYNVLLLTVSVVQSSYAQLFNRMNGVCVCVYGGVGWCWADVFFCITYSMQLIFHTLSASWSFLGGNVLPRASFSAHYLPILSVHQSWCLSRSQSTTISPFHTQLFGHVIHTQLQHLDCYYHCFSRSILFYHIFGSFQCFFSLRYISAHTHISFDFPILNIFAGFFMNFQYTKNRKFVDVPPLPI